MTVASGVYARKAGSPNADSVFKALCRDTVGCGGIADLTSLRTSGFANGISQASSSAKTLVLLGRETTSSPDNDSCCILSSGANSAYVTITGRVYRSFLTIPRMGYKDDLGNTVSNQKKRGGIAG